MDGEIKIEHGVPLPQWHGYVSALHVVAQRMRVGDSVVVRKAQAQSLVKYLRRLGGDGCTSRVGIAKGFTRVWRVEKREEPAFELGEVA